MIPGIVAGQRSVPGPEFNYSPWDVSALPTNVTASEGDYRLVRSGGSNASRIIVHPSGKSAGKFSMRFWMRRVSGLCIAVGLRNSGSTGTFLGGNAAGWALFCNQTTGSNKHQVYNNNAFVALANLQSIDIPTSAPDFAEIMMDVDIGEGRLWFGINGTWGNSGDPESGAGAIYSNLSGTLEVACEAFYPGTLQLLTPAQFSTPATPGFIPGWPD